MTELAKSKGLKAYGQVAKQVITLCSSAIAFTVTFLDKLTVLGKNDVRHVATGLYAAWAFLGLAIVCSLWTLTAITRILVSLDRQANGWPLSESQRLAAQGESAHVQISAFMTLATFLAAILSLIWTGVQLAPR